MTQIWEKKQRFMEQEKTKDITVLVPAAGPPPVEVANFFGGGQYVLAAGRPALCWVIKNIIESGYKNIIVGIRDLLSPEGKVLKRTFGTKSNLEIIEVGKTNSVGETLLQLQTTAEKRSFLLVLGDTVAELGDLSFANNEVLVSYAEKSKRWCQVRVSKDNFISEIADKQDTFLDKGQLALVGVYYIKDAFLFWEGLKEAFANNKRAEISDGLGRIMAQESIKAISAKMWLDFGNLDNLLDARKLLIQTRAFNSITMLDPIRGVIGKTSQDSDILLAEVNYYKILPSELSIFFPRGRLIKANKDSDISLELEFYGYPTLAEAFVFQDIPLSHWKRVFEHILEVFQVFGRYRWKPMRDDYRQMYIEKTKKRLELLTNDSEWARRLGFAELKINGVVCSNIGRLMKDVEKWLEGLKLDEDHCVIHGDPCFSNILYDFNNRLIKFIDPRGNFGQAGVFGDQKYDIAKLRHSACGYYDFIVNDIFSLQRLAPDEYEFSIDKSKATRKISECFDSIFGACFDLRSIKIIEGLLFVSMVPLHFESKQRQLVMYLKGIKLLNEIFNGGDQ